MSNIEYPANFASLLMGSNVIVSITTILQRTMPLQQGQFSLKSSDGRARLWFVIFKLKIYFVLGLVVAQIYVESITVTS